MLVEGNKNSSTIKLSVDAKPLPLEEDWWKGETGESDGGRIPAQFDSLFCLQQRRKKRKNKEDY